jgi:uncharacterized protein YjiK
MSCDQQKKNNVDFPYDLSIENHSSNLPNSLREISGVAWDNERSFYCINDEKGIVYHYDIDKGKIDRKLDFGKNKDYEDLALIGNTLFILESNGNIFQFDIPKKKKKAKVDALKIETALDQSFDAEGLCYDQKSNALLIACKAKAGKGDQFKNKKAIYKFDLQSNTFSKEPEYLIDLDQIRKMKRVGKTQATYDKFMEKIGENNITFNPSAIAIHPLTDDIYIIASSGKTLLVMNRKGEPKKALHLDAKTFKQPEGLTFDNDGNMYISNEGRNGKANIKIFNFNSDGK